MDLNSFCKHWLQAWTGNRPEHLISFYADDAFYRDPARPLGLKGPELLGYFKKLLAANPHWQWRAEEILPTASGFCLKWQATIPVGAVNVEESGLDIVELANGKITRNEVWFDRSQLAAAWAKYRPGP